jgi:hypothetical protein
MGMNMDPAERWLTLLAASVIALIILFLYTIPVHAHDHDHPELDAWYTGLMQPDNPTMSCCGKADAYWCDDYFAKDGKAYCRITDDRKVMGRPHVEVGTLIEIPPYKLKWDRGNPTGHAVVFLSTMGHVFCFVQSGGV